MKPLYTRRLVSFPPPELALDEGLLDLSDDLRVERLLEAYSFGIFPWPQEGVPTMWFSPPRRGVLDFDRLHVPRSLRRAYARATWRFTLDEAFCEVIESCSRIDRKGENGTWITGRLLDAYTEFHRAGYAHSLEVWEGDHLIGGVYGVYVGGVFCGESMFHRRPNASKCALLRLIEFLQEQGVTWMDIQMVSPVLQALGGRYIERREFLMRLELSRHSARPIDFKI